MKIDIVNVDFFVVVYLQKGKLLAFIFLLKMFFIWKNEEKASEFNA